jgi:hypothetical protein
MGVFDSIEGIEKTVEEHPVATLSLAAAAIAMAVATKGRSVANDAEALTAIRTDPLGALQSIYPGSGPRQAEALSYLMHSPGSFAEVSSSKFNLWWRSTNLCDRTIQPLKVAVPQIQKYAPEIATKAVSQVSEFAAKNFDALKDESGLLTEDSIHQAMQQTSGTTKQMLALVDKCRELGPEAPSLADIQQWPSKLKYFVPQALERTTFAVPPTVLQA